MSVDDSSVMRLSSSSRASVAVYACHIATTTAAITVSNAAQGFDAAADFDAASKVLVAAVALLNESATALTPEASVFTHAVTAGMALAVTSHVAIVNPTVLIIGARIRQLLIRLRTALNNNAITP